jgi:hypothetical protein
MLRDRDEPMHLFALIPALRFRAGIEGRISVLRRRFGLDRCQDHGEAGFRRWVGWGIVTANLVTIAHTLAGRSGHSVSRAACPLA